MKALTASGNGARRERGNRREGPSGRAMDAPELSNLNTLKTKSLDGRRPVAKVAHVKSMTCDRICAQMTLISLHPVPGRIEVGGGGKSRESSTGPMKEPCVRDTALRKERLMQPEIAAPDEVDGDP